MSILALISLFFLSAAAFSQVESPSPEAPSETAENKAMLSYKDALESLTPIFHADGDEEAEKLNEAKGERVLMQDCMNNRSNPNASLRQHSSDFLAFTVDQHAISGLTPEELTEFLTAYQKALTDPAVQSTREIARMALHHAMLRIDPSVETIIANMDASGPQSGVEVSRHNKSLGENFQQWLTNFPASATASLTLQEKEILKQTHAKAVLDPSVQKAYKTASLTFYNAITNADPLIVPLLSKVGIEKPSSVQPLSQKSHLGSEERILGGNVQAWGEEILAPAIQNQGKPPEPKPASGMNL